MSDKAVSIPIPSLWLLGAFFLLGACVAVPDRQATADSGCVPQDIPAAAKQLGFTKVVIDSCPTPDDVSIDGRGMFEWYSGHQWFAPSKQPKPESYTRNDQGQLLINLGGSVTTVMRATMKPGKFPLLAGSKGFYVEFTTQLSDNNKDHFPAVWLMPAEHRRGKPDHYSGDPAGFERWLELDVDEGGFTKGFKGTALSWTGEWPHYANTQSHPRWDVPVLDRTKVNTFAAAFQPGDLKVTWWLNGEEQYSAGPPAVPEIARQQNFYLIVNSNHHGKSVPYWMRVIRVRAFVPE